MKITKGVIAAAGKGTRFLPVTKAMPKEMLPILDKPIIQYVVEEFVEAGIEDIVIVTSWDNRAIEDHFDHTRELEDHLRESGKTDKLEEIRRIAEMANFIYIRQKGPYGNGTPCRSARSVVGDESFVYAFGDDLVLSPRSFTRGMIEDYEKQAGVYVGVQEVRDEDVERYGIIRPAGELRRGIAEFVEKPKPDEAPSRLAVFGRYVLPPEIFQAFEHTSAGKGGELWMNDAVNYLISQGKKVYYKEVEDGSWYTTGDPVNYLRAVRAYAQASPQYQTKVKDIFNEETKR